MIKFKFEINFQISNIYFLKLALEYFIITGAQISKTDGFGERVIVRRGSAIIYLLPRFHFRIPFEGQRDSGRLDFMFGAKTNAFHIVSL